MNRLAKIYLSAIFLLSCNSPSFESPCDIHSGSFVKTFTLRLALNDQSQYCGISSLNKTISNSNGNSSSNGTSPTVSSISPLNSTSGVTIGTPVTITFDKTMNTQSLTIQTSDGTCSGSIQISSDNFTSCLGGTSSFSADQKTVSITTVTHFCVESSYSLKVKVTTSAKDTQGNPLAAESTSSTAFQTQFAVLKVGATGGSGVIAMTVSCNTLYIAGSFTTVGASTRNNVAAIDLAKGYETSTVPGTNNIVNTIAVSGSSIYIGGSFSNAGGQARNNIAALDTTTGLATSWNPSASSVVNSIVISGNTMYVGGTFTTIAGQSRNRIAELDLTTGNATAWNPNGNTATINAIAFDATNVYLGGSFTAVNIGGQVYTHLAVASRSTGAGIAGWCPITTTFPVSALLLTGGVLYVGGAFGGNLCSIVIYNFGGLVPATAANSSYPSGGGTGAGGTVSAIAVGGTNLYAGGAFNGGGSFFGQVRNYAGSTNTAGVINSWDPNPNNTVSAIATVGSAVIIGGTFTTVNGGTAANRLAIVEASTGIIRP